MLQRIALFVFLAVIFLFSPAVEISGQEIFLLDGLLLVVVGIAGCFWILHLCQISITPERLFVYVAVGMLVLGALFSGPEGTNLTAALKLALLFATVALATSLCQRTIPTLNTIKSFLRVFLIMALLIYALIPSQRIDDASVGIPRVALRSLELGEGITLVGSSSILIGTFAAIGFLFFLLSDRSTASYIAQIGYVVLLLLSGTRASIALLLLALILLPTFIRHLRRIAILWLAVFGGIATISAADLTQRIFDSGSNVARLVLYDAALQMYVNYPWFGIGANRFRAAKEQYTLLPLPEHYDTHSDFLKTLAEGGLIQASGYVLLIFATIWLTKRAVRDYRGELDPAAAIALSLFGGVAALVMLLHGLVDNFVFAKNNEYLLALFLGMALAGQSCNRKEYFSSI